jgi:hypothetical protein
MSEKRLKRWAANLPLEDRIALQDFTIRLYKILG